LEPVIWNLGENFGEDGWVESSAGEGGGLFEVGGPGEENVVANVGEGKGGEAVGVGPVVVEVESGTVVDEVGPVVPGEEVGVAGGAVDVEGEGVEPDSERCGAGVGCVAGGGIEHGGAGEIVQGQVDANAGAEEIANILIGLVASEGRVDLDEDEFGDVKADGATDFSGDKFGYKGEGALTSATKFDDIEAEVVSLYDCGEGSTFAEGRDVLGGADSTKHCCLV